MYKKLLEKSIGEKQRKELISIIYKQLHLHVMDSNRTLRTQVARPEYAPHRGESDLTWAIYSGFPSGNNNLVSGFVIENLPYGKGYRQPILKNDQTTLMILSRGANKNAVYLQQYYDINTSNNVSNNFVFLTYDITDNQLRRITL